MFLLTQGRNLEGGPGDSHTHLPCSLQPPGSSSTSAFHPHCHSCDPCRTLTRTPDLFGTSSFTLTCHLPPLARLILESVTPFHLLRTLPAFPGFQVSQVVWIPLPSPPSAPLLSQRLTSRPQKCTFSKLVSSHFPYTHYTSKSRSAASQPRNPPPPSVHLVNSCLLLKTQHTNPLFREVSQSGKNQSPAKEQRELVILAAFFLKFRALPLAPCLIYVSVHPNYKGRSHRYPGFANEDTRVDWVQWLAQRRTASS